MSPTKLPARPLRIYPVLYSHDVEAASAFYIEHFDFEPTFTSDWYVSLRHRAVPDYELAFVDKAHPTIPEGSRGIESRLLVNIEVEDATAEAQRLEAAGATIVLPLRDEPFGQRHLIVEGPDNVLIDVIEEIAPSEEFAAQFVGNTVS